MTRATYHHGALAEALIDAAVDQVRAQGSERVTLRGVAQAVGVSPSAAYNHFADKDALLAAVAERGQRELDRRIAVAAAANDAVDEAAAIARLRAIAGAYIGFAHDDPNLFRHAFGPHLAHGGEGAAVRSEAYATLNDALDDLDGRGLLRPSIRPGLDLVVWSMVHGFAGIALEGLCAWNAAGVLVDGMERAMLTDAALAAR